MARSVSAASVPADTLKEIQRCFTAAPFRFRLKPAEALEKYRKAEALCADAIERATDDRPAQKDPVPGPSTNAATNLIINDILLRSVGRLSRGRCRR